MMMKRKIDGVVFDLDGTVYLGENALPGAVETILELLAGKPSPLMLEVALQYL